MMPGEIVVLSGVPVEQTPVIGAFINCARGCGQHVRLIEYRGSRLRFVAASLRYAFTRRRGTRIFFIGLQSLPALVVASRLAQEMELYYWALESYAPGDGTSLAVRLSALEGAVSHCRVVLLLPIEERASRYNRHRYARVAIVPNVPCAGRRFIPRQLRHGDTIRLVYYGNMDPEKTYIDELIDRVRESDRLELTTIGRYDGSRPAHARILHRGPLPHAALIDSIENDYHYAVVGYKPVNFNWTNCAPNKFYESLSCSLPIVANRLNPTLARLVEETGAGLDGSFADLSWLDYDLLFSDYERRNQSAHDAYRTRYNFEAAIADAGLL